MICFLFTLNADVRRMVHTDGLNQHLNGNVQAVAAAGGSAGATGRGAAEPRSQKLLLQRRIGLLRAGQISSLQSLPYLAEQCLDGGLLAGALLVFRAVVMVVVVDRPLLRTGLLRVLLNGDNVRLRRGEIARLKVLRKFSDRLGQRTGRRGCCGRVGRCGLLAARTILLQRRKIALAWVKLPECRSWPSFWKPCLTC
jgi:hypothetical protein